MMCGMPVKSSSTCKHFSGGKTIVNGTLEFTPCGFFVSTAPLFEKERNVSTLALIADVEHPGFVP